MLESWGWGLLVRGGCWLLFVEGGGGFVYHALDVRGSGALTIVCRGFLPSRLLHARCIGSSGPVMDPPLPTGSMWLAVKLIGFFHQSVVPSRSQSKGLPHRWQGAPVRLHWRLSASRFAT